MVTLNSESTVYPIEWDTDSSPDWVYHNYNIQEIIPIDEDNPIMYRYNVDKYTKIEYLEYENKWLKEQNKSLSQELIDVQLALCNIYETQQLK